MGTNLHIQWEKNIQEKRLPILRSRLSLLVAVGLLAADLISEPKFGTMWNGEVMYVKHSDG